MFNLECHHLCLSCFNRTNEKCYSCVETAKLVGNSTCEIISPKIESKIVSLCNPEKLQLCLKCNVQKCSECMNHALFDIKDNECYCKKSYINVNNECIRRKCDAKLKLCIKCESDKECSRCKKNATLFGKNCFCNEGFTYDGVSDSCKGKFLIFIEKTQKSV